MTINVNAITKAAVANPIAAASIYNKAELYAVIDSIAQQIRKPGESIEKARMRASATPEGMAVMAAYSAAPKAKPVQKAAPVSVDELRKAMPGGSVIAQIDEAARKIAAEERMPMTRARAEAWKRNPDLKRAYDARANLRRIDNGRA